MSSRRRDVIASVVVAGALALALALPAMASAGLIGRVVDRVAATVQQVAGHTAEPSDGQAGEKAGTPPDYTPPLHGTNPHGQGTVAVVDLTPEDTEPLDYEPGGGSEDIVVGRARGEQNDGDYHGHITIAGLLGTEVLGVDTNEGESEAGPLDPIQMAILDAACDGSGDSICLEVLTADSSTNGDGSTNHFAVTNASLGPQGSLATADVASSDGNISDDGQCQTATGSSRVVGADVGAGLVTADVLRSTSTSSACNDGSTTQDNTSHGINVLGTGLPLPAAGCENGTPNTVFNPAVIGLLVSAVCNADDSNGAQAALPYGVREALSVFVLPVLGAPVKTTTAEGESQAVAPGCPDGQILVGGECVCPPGTVLSDGRCVEPPPTDGGPPGEEERERGGGAAGPGAGPGGELPFTGSDLLVLLLVGLSVMGAGMAGMAYADERRRPTS